MSNIPTALLHSVITMIGVQDKREREKSREQEELEEFAELNGLTSLFPSQRLFERDCTPKSTLSEDEQRDRKKKNKQQKKSRKKNRSRK